LEVLKFEAQVYAKNRINPEIIRSRVEQQLTGGFGQSDEIGGSGMKNVEKMLRGGGQGKRHEGMVERQNSYAMTSKRGSEVAMNPLVGQSSDEKVVLGAAQERYNRKK